MLVSTVDASTDAGAASAHAAAKRAAARGRPRGARGGGRGRGCRPPRGCRPAASRRRTACATRGLGHPLGRAGEHRADRGAEPLGQADADRVELRAVLVEPDAGRHVGVPRPRPVEVHRDADGRCGGPHRADRLDRLHGAATEVVGVLEHDERGLHLVRPDPGRDERHRTSRVEQPAVTRPGAARDAGERRRRTELGPQHVGLLVGDELLARRDVEAHPELVGERPRGGEEPGLVPQQPRDLLLERPDGRVLPRTRRRRPRPAPSPRASPVSDGSGCRTAGLRHRRSSVAVSPG